MAIWHLSAVGSSRRSRAVRPAAAEGLEPRRLLSAAITIWPTVAPPAVRHAHRVPPRARGARPAAVTPDTVPTGPFTPTQLRHFYGADSVRFNGVAGDGTGQTIAVVVFANEPNLKSDLTYFDTYFGVAAPPSLVIENQNGSTTSLPANDNDYGLVTAADVEWTHAMAPGANLVVIEVGTGGASFANYLTGGVGRANLTAGVSVVDIPYGTAEFAGEGTYDSTFTTAGITYVAEVGDDGSAQTGYPATSPDVVAVGGTRITAGDSAASYGSETVWNETATEDGATGGNISPYEAKPAYQGNVTQSATNRTTPDVSFDADARSGFEAYDTYGYNGLLGLGSTTLAASCWAGLFAVADQGRAAAGLPSLTGFSQTLPRLYQLSSSDFHDVTTGNNNYQGTGGYVAGVGYDLASGLGTPVENTLVADLAGGATVTGRAFEDDNFDGTFDGTDAPLASLAGQTVYLDLNNNGSLDTAGPSAEPTATVAADGTFSFASQVTGGDLIGGLSGTVRLASGTPAGYVLNAAGSGFATAYDTASAVGIGLFPTAYTVSTAGATYTLVAPSPTTLQIVVNGAIAYTAPTFALPSLSFTFTGTGDALVVDYADADPVPFGGVTVNGTTPADGDTLSVLGTMGNDTITVNGNAVRFGSDTIAYADVPNLSVDPRGGTDALTVNAGTVTVPAEVLGAGIVVRTFATLAVTSGASLVVGVVGRPVRPDGPGHR